MSELIDKYIKWCTFRPTEDGKFVVDIKTEYKEVKHQILWSVYVDAHNLNLSEQII